MSDFDPGLRADSSGENGQQPSLPGFPQELVEIVGFTASQSIVRGISHLETIDRMVHARDPFRQPGQPAEADLSFLEDPELAETVKDHGKGLRVEQNFGLISSGRQSHRSLAKRINRLARIASKAEKGFAKDAKATDNVLDQLEEPILTTRQRYEDQGTLDLEAVGTLLDSLREGAGRLPTEAVVEGVKKTRAAANDPAERAYAMLKRADHSFGITNTVLNPAHVLEAGLWHKLMSSIHGTQMLEETLDGVRRRGSDYHGTLIDLLKVYQVEEAAWLLTALDTAQQHILPIDQLKEARQVDAALVVEEYLGKQAEWARAIIIQHDVNRLNRDEQLQQAARRAAATRVANALAAQTVPETD